MLIGRLPFCGTSAREVLIATVEHPVPRPRALRPDIEPAMERLLLTGLAKRPEDRFQTAAEFRRHLAAAAAGRVPRHARPCVTETCEP
jgi:serine/threonine-protein kinase